MANYFIKPFSLSAKNMTNVHMFIILNSETSYLTNFRYLYPDNRIYIYVLV